MSSITAISPVQASSAARPAGQPRPQATIAAELPDAPKPVTPANAAVHIMKIPTSRVVEAFVSLQRALGQQSRSEAPITAASPRPPRLSASDTMPAPLPLIDLEA
jgi:hypothetical protein